MTPLTELTPYTELLPPTKSGKARYIRWYRDLRREGYSCDHAVIVSQEGREDDGYGVTEFETRGGRAFRVRKAGGAETYQVFCADAPTVYLPDSCTCAAACYGRVARCRHLEMTRAALDNGWIAPRSEERPAEWSDPYTDDELDTLAREYAEDERVGRGELIRVA